MSAVWRILKEYAFFTAWRAGIPGAKLGPINPRPRSGQVGQLQVETTYINIAERKWLLVEEKITLAFFAAAFLTCTFFGVDYFRNLGEYLLFFFGMLIPVFLGLTLVRWLTFKTRNPFTHENVMGVIRVAIALFMGFYAFSHMKVLIPLINSANYDELFARMDKFLFLGRSPTLLLLNINSPIFMKLMYFSYASFYAAFPVSFAVAFLSRNIGEMRRLVLGIMVIYFFGLAIFYIFPSVGPLFYTPELFADIPNKWQKVLWDGHLAIQANRETFTAAPFLGVAALPSLHGAHALFLVLVAHRYHKKLFYAYLPWIILLYISTIYMGWHYVVDLIAGALIAIVICSCLIHQANR